MHIDPHKAPICQGDIGGARVLIGYQTRLRLVPYDTLFGRLPGHSKLPQAPPRGLRAGAVKARVRYIACTRVVAQANEAYQ
jgi:hypothetical protein